MRVPQIAKRDFERLRELIEDWCGIALEPQKTYLVESRLRELVMHHGCQTYGEFYELARRGDPELRAGIIDAMTTNETSWFRDPYWWEAMRAVILPEVIEAALREGRQRLRLWSAAASTGQELHSTSILLDEMHRSDELSGLSPGCFDLLGTDICRPALTIARAGRYDPHSMRRGLPRGLRDRHFQRAGSVWTLSEELRKRTRFEYLNLLPVI
jgi:chemotaxis protein methyltransferase CheR